MVGNSSSGLAEVPSFKKGTINIGDRQRGRLRVASVLDCEPERAAKGNPREPAHLHVRRTGIEATFWLTPDVQLARNDGFDAPSLRCIERLVRQHREHVLRAWNEDFA